MKLLISGAVAALVLTAGAPAAVAQPAPAPTITAPVAPEPTAIEVREDGMYMRMFVPAGLRGRAPAIVVLGGSEGGIEGAARRAKRLAQAGYVTLAIAYFAADGLPPALIEIPLETFDKRRPVEKLRLINRKCAEMLRGNAPLCELLSGEFVRSNEMKLAVEHVRQLVRLDFERVLRSDPVLSGEDYLALNTIAYAATTYLALRAHCQPRFFGFDLSTETSWQIVMNMFDRVMDNAEIGIASRSMEVD